MLEPWRSQYLSAMGVELYVPRAILPGAKLSLPCEWDEQALVEPEIEPVDIAELIAPTTPTQPVRRAPPLEQTRAQRRSEPIAPTPSADNAATPRFTLSIISGDNGVLIVDDAPSGARTDYLRMLGNLLFALQGGTANPTLEVFAWPMAKTNPRLDQSATAAREALAGYLQKHIDQRAVHTVLVLGDAARSWAAPALQQNNALRCAVSVSAWLCLREPQVKRQLWQDVRHLVAANR
jgi:hypothetical protein